MSGAGARCSSFRARPLSGSSGRIRGRNGEVFRLRAHGARGASGAQGRRRGRGRRRGQEARARKSRQGVAGDVARAGWPGLLGRARGGDRGVSERPEGTEAVAPGRGAHSEFLVDNDDALAALVNLIAVLGDNEYFLGRRVSEWADAGPLLESTAACAAITQDKLGHSRAIYPLLEELPWPKAPTGLQGEVDRARRYSVSFLDEPLPSWSNVVAALALVGPAVNVVLESVENSRYEALARRAHRILDEEKLTSAYAESLVRQIAYEERGRRLLQERVDELLPEMLCWFGPDGEPGIEALRAEGLASMGNEEMRQKYLDRVVPLLQGCGIEVPVGRNKSDNGWEYGELPWSRWNHLQRRLERS